MNTKFFNGKNVLIISPESWSHLFVSKHHYAIQLSSCNKVYFLNPPLYAYRCTETAYKNVWQIDYTKFIKGLRFFPAFVKRLFMRSKYDRLQHLAKVKFDCVWSFDNSVFFDLSFLPTHVLRISHIVDLSQNFQLGNAASTAHICFGVSQNIVDRLRQYNPNSFLIPHGFATAISQPLNPVLPGVNSIKVMYAGNLNSRYLDKITLYQLINNHPDIDFIFLGSGGDNWERRNNTYFPGVISREHLSSYLEKADVLLLLYDVEKYSEQLTNSHKILEYLNSGKIIVSSYISDYADKSHLLKMVKKNNEIPKVLSEVKAALSIHNSEINITVRKKFASENSYSQRLQEIEILLSSVLN